MVVPSHAPVVADALYAQLGGATKIPTLCELPERNLITTLLLGVDSPIKRILLLVI